MDDNFNQSSVSPYKTYSIIKALRMNKVEQNVASIAGSAASTDKKMDNLISLMQQVLEAIGDVNKVLDEINGEQPNA